MESMETVIALPLPVIHRAIPPLLSHLSDRISLFCKISALVDSLVKIVCHQLTFNKKIKFFL
jgi:hypothetical protein